jgi:hypothetical protein
LQKFRIKVCKFPAIDATDRASWAQTRAILAPSFSFAPKAQFFTLLYENNMSEEDALATYFFIFYFCVFATIHYEVAV